MKPIVYKNKKGEVVSYQLQVYLGKKEDGTKDIRKKTWKPERKYTDKQLEREIYQQTLLFEQELKAKSVDTSKLKDQFTFREFSSKWLNEYAKHQLRKTTVKNYEIALKRINEGIGDIRLNKLTPVHFVSFFNNLRESGVKLTDKTQASGLSEKTIKNFRSIISSILNTAVEWRILETNPIQGVKAPKITRKKVEALEKDDVVMFFKLLDQEPLKFNVFIKLAILSGMRRGELMGLKWSAIDFVNKLITIETTSLYTPESGIFEDTTKTEGSKRVIKLSDSIFELLKQYKEEQDSKKSKLGDQWIDKDYLFTQWNGEPMHPNTPYTWFTRWQVKYGLKHCSIHMLRHTTATLLIMEGANVKSVSARLGHTNTSTTTNIYTSYLKTADEMVANALDEILDLK
jgi:integrase